jgi:thiol-disulfide isomerase/thioredoxin
MDLDTTATTGERMRWELRDLAPGVYKAQGFPADGRLDEDALRDSIDPDRLHKLATSAGADLLGAESAAVTLEFDPSGEQPDINAGWDQVRAAVERTQPVRGERKKPQAKPLMTFRIEDPDGMPVPGAQLAVKKQRSIILDTRFSPTDANGEVKLTLDDVREYVEGWTAEGAYDLAARAPGWAATVVTADLPTSDSRLTVRLVRGRRLELVVEREDGRAVPETLMPVACRMDKLMLGQMALGRRGGDADAYAIDRYDLSPMERTGPGRYAFRVPDNPPSFYVLMDEPELVRALRAGPFAEADLKEGVIRVTVPATGALEAWFGALEGEQVPYRHCGIEVARISPDADGKPFWHQFDTREARGSSVSLTVDYLLPGEYNVESYTGTATTKHSGSRSGAFIRREKVRVEAGTTATARIFYKPFDPAKLRGPHTAAVRVTRFGGAPAAGAPYKLTFHDGTVDREVAGGTLDAAGRADLRNLAGGPAIGYGFDAGGRHLGFIHIADAATTRAEFEFRMPPADGDAAPDPALCDLATSAPARLSDFRGRVLIVEFWSTGCGPCQPAMDDLSALAEKRAAGWRDTVAVVSVSIDADPDAVRRHIAKKAWASVRHLWCASDAGWESAAAMGFVIKSLPTAVVIDRDGKVRYHGHAAGAAQVAEKLAGSGE